MQDAEVRAALGPRTALNDSETAAVQAEVEKVKGERTISLVRREAEEEEEAGASRSDGEGEGAKKLEEVLTGITDQDAEAKRCAPSRPLFPSLFFRCLSCPVQPYGTTHMHGGILWQTLS